MNKWRKFCQLSWADRWLLAQAFLLLPLMALAIRTFSCKRWLTALPRLAPIERKPDSESIIKARAVAQLVQTAAGHVFYQAGCLPKSITLWWLLRRLAIPCELRIGVRKQGGKFEAHAWVEHRGRSLSGFDNPSGDFAPFHCPIAS